MVADLPVSLVAYMLGWKFQLVAAVWIFVAGTWWWYFLSLVMERAIHRFQYHYSHRHEGSVTRLGL